MDYKWEQFGDEIKQSVQDAVERGDFSRLNQTVNDSVSRAADAIRSEEHTSELQSERQMQSHGE